MTLEILTRIIHSTGTKNEIETFAGVLEETVIGHATDTDEMGVYTNGVWHWIPMGSTYWEPMTNGDPDSTEIMFNNGDVLMNEVKF